MAGGLELTFPGQKENLKSLPWQVTAMSPSATVQNEQSVFLWAGSLPDPVRTAQGGTCFTSADDSKAVVTCGLPSSPSSILQQLPSLLLPLMVSEPRSEEPNARHCIGLPDIPHFFSELSIDVH